MKPSIHYLRQCFRLLPDGRLIWRRRPIAHFSSAIVARRVNTQRAGTQAGCIGKDGYLVVRVATLLLPAHVIVWAMSRGSWPELEIDHRDRDRGNNRPTNLRLAQRWQNMANMPAHADSATGIKGVRREPSGRFSATIMVRRQRIGLGTFDDSEAASAAYRSASIHHHGEFSYVQQPSE